MGRSLRREGVKRKKRISIRSNEDENPLPNS